MQMLPNLKIITRIKVLNCSSFVEQISIITLVNATILWSLFGFVECMPNILVSVFSFFCYFQKPRISQAAQDTIVIISDCYFQTHHSLFRMQSKSDRTWRIPNSSSRCQQSQLCGTLAENASWSERRIRRGLFQIQYALLFSNSVGQ